MIRILNVLAVAALIGSAGYAYQIKYETAYYAEKLAKMRHLMDKEKDNIGVLRAEWAHLTRPDRLQVLSDKFLDLQAPALVQMVRASDLPARAAKFDAIGRKLDLLGLGQPTNTPQDASALPPTTPAAKAR